MTAPECSRILSPARGWRLTFVAPADKFAAWQTNVLRS